MFQWIANLFRPSSPDNQPVFFFVHLPKCAGTSVIQALGRGMKKDWIIVSDSPASKQQANADLVTTASKAGLSLDRLRLVMGHDVHLRMHEIPSFQNRQPFYFSFLRDPVERYVSHYRYLVSCSVNQDHPLNGFASQQVGSADKRITLDQYIEAKQMPNLMSQYLGAANCDDLSSKRWSFDNNTLWNLAESAIAQLDFIGFQDSIETDVNQLAKIVQISTKVPRSNVTAGTRADLSEDQHARISRLNDLDCELFQLAKRKSNHL